MVLPLVNRLYPEWMDCHSFNLSLCLLGRLSLLLLPLGLQSSVSYTALSVDSELRLPIDRRFSVVLGSNVVPRLFRNFDRRCGRYIQIDSRIGVYHGSVGLFLFVIALAPAPVCTPWIDSASRSSNGRTSTLSGNVDALLLRLWRQIVHLLLVLSTVPFVLCSQFQPLSRTVYVPVYL